jgi:hypothetical protein
VEVSEQCRDLAIEPSCYTFTVSVSYAQVEALHQSSYPSSANFRTGVSLQHHDHDSAENHGKRGASPGCFAACKLCYVRLLAELVAWNHLHAIIILRQDSMQRSLACIEMLAYCLALEHNEIGVTRAEAELAGKFNISNVFPRIKPITHGKRAQGVKLLKLGQEERLVSFL